MGEHIFILIVMLIYFFFVFVVLPLATVGSAVVMIMVIVNYLGALRVGFSGRLRSAQHEGPVGQEPAYKNYFFQRAFRDIQDIWREAHERNTNTIIERLQGYTRASHGWYTWPLAVVFVIVRFVAIVSAYAFLTIVGAIHSVIVGTIWIIIYPMCNT